MEVNIIVPELDTFGIPLTPPEHPAQFERISDQRMNGVPVLNVEEIDSLTEYLRLVVFLNSQTLFCVQASQTLYLSICNGIIH